MVHVDDLSSDVTVEPGGAAPTEGAPNANLEDELRALQERLARDARRTASEAYGD